jgi:hypothetical protein
MQMIFFLPGSVYFRLLLLEDCAMNISNTNEGSFRRRLGAPECLYALVNES